MTFHKLLLTITGLTALGMSSVLYAHHNTEYARVIHVEPIYELQERRYTEPTGRRHHQHRRHDRHASTIVGGAIGAAIGHSVSHNKRAGALIGGLIGAKVGHDAHKHGQKRHYHAQHSEHRRYEPRYYERQYREPRRILVGYNVTYRHHGRTRTTFMREYPNKRIAISTRHGRHHHHNRRHS